MKKLFPSVVLFVLFINTLSSKNYFSFGDPIKVTISYKSKSVKEMVILNLENKGTFSFACDELEKLIDFKISGTGGPYTIVFKPDSKIFPGKKPFKKSNITLTDKFVFSANETEKILEYIFYGRLQILKDGKVVYSHLFDANPCD
ncbi:MAG: hypothetical protein ACK5D5_06660 [Bacteroidota bacterium]|jgi:hypothetical protein